MFRLICTCGACPEQYDVFVGDDLVGYMRLRHGHFRAEYRGMTVYEADTIGDGIFEDGERDRHLHNACMAIKNAMAGIDGYNIYTIETERPSTEW